MAEADPASIRLEDREDLHVKPDPDAMVDGHANGIEIQARAAVHASLVLNAWAYTLCVKCVPSMALLCGAVGQWLHLTAQFCRQLDMAVVSPVPLNHTVELCKMVLRCLGTGTAKGLKLALLFCVLCMALLFLFAFALL